ncbi:hypothetical protein OG885_43525 [Streptomyces sp. NBC_00028]|uniref:hypothetical protein n=1 Tax=Streptomyces sp. NBC_00028 TaxID=2975624 RepID=UPI00324A1D6E
MLVGLGVGIDYALLVFELDGGARSVAVSVLAEPELAPSSFMAQGVMKARPGAAGERSYQPVELFDVLPDHGERGVG